MNEANDLVFTMRLEQIYGLFAIAFWFVAMIIGPLGHIIDKNHTKHLEFSRRAIGVSAFYFASLHLLIAFFGQLGGLSQLPLLPGVFVWTLSIGLIAWVVLLALASTSFDAVIKRMTFRKWKWLHRFTYLGMILVLLHIWVLGTHIVYPWISYTFYGMIVLLLAIELYPTSKLVNKYLKLSESERWIAFLAVWLGLSLALLIVPNVAPNINATHDHSGNRNNLGGGHRH